LLEQLDQTVIGPCLPEFLPALLALALSAFTSATILPGTSEALLLALAAVPAAPYWLLLTVASAANVAGSCVNWLIGRLAAQLRGTRWFPEGETLARAERFWARWGKWSLLLSWAPFVGDPLTVVAGLLRVPFPTFLIIVAVAKTTRYAAVMWLAGQL
jgi:membrane protein YqaA with SNARE-associated domain